MNSLFNIWNPYLLPPSGLSFDVTPADVALIRNGSVALIADCLQACGLTAEASSWKISCVRQSYYSDYRHSADWRARWDIAWIVEVMLSTKIYVQNTFQIVPRAASVLDETAEDYDEPTIDLGPALLMATFLASKDIEQKIIYGIFEWKVKRGIASDIRLEWRRFLGGYLQIRVLVNSLKFPDEINELELLQENWRQVGGITNWRELFRNM